MSCRTKKQIFWDNIKAHREMVERRSVSLKPKSFLLVDEDITPADILKSRPKKVIEAMMNGGYVKDEH